MCPHNEPTDRSRERPVHAGYEARHDGFDLLEVLGWTEDDRRRVFAGSALKRAKLGMMKRNALIAAGNALRSGDHPALQARIEEIAGDAGEDDMVRRTAREALVSDADSGA